jgi:intracellular sulfur oxidation DsrE/DsrF family protein
LDPIGISIQLSELAPLMNLRQAEKTNELQLVISQLAISKLRAADKGDRNKYDILEKQQIQAALAALQIIQEIENAI